MKLAKPAGGLSHIQPPPDGASKAGGGPFCESGHRAWYPGKDRSQAPGGCPCSSRNGRAGPRAWYPGEDVCSGPRRVPLQPHGRGAGPRYGTASQYRHRHLGVAVQLSVHGRSPKKKKKNGVNF